jgi:hypothetical protein
VQSSLVLITQFIVHPFGPTHIGFLGVDSGQHNVSFLKHLKGFKIVAEPLLVARVHLGDWMIQITFGVTRQSRKNLSRF